MSFYKKPTKIKPEEVDPSVYYYDEVYENIKNVKETSKSQKVNDPGGSSSRGPAKYIQGLIANSEERKTDKEIRKFKRYAKDREDAASRGDLEHTEVFVTGSYKRKLKEIDELEEKKRRLAEISRSHSMNFLKSSHKSPKHNDERKSSHKSPEHDERKLSLNHDKKKDAHVVPCTESTQVSAGTSKSGVEEKPSKRPKTFEEKKNLLRKILAKRTVGKSFYLAVQRYKKRLASVQLKDFEQSPSKVHV